MLNPVDTLPAREVERSAALHSYQVLDTPREADFDDLARIASEVCGTPIAVVNLVDTARQFFKAEVGLGVRETPLETSFCGHAILSEDFMMVPDATKDPRFDCNPLVTESPRLRFYAGALLKTREGLPIGTMCVLDTVPRELDAHQVQTLKLLARQAMSQLDLRRTLVKLRQAEDQVRSDNLRLTQMFEQAPSFMALLEGSEHRVSFANAAFQTMIGNREISGRTIKEALPDAAAQGFATILDEVYRTGKPYNASDALYAVEVEPGRIVERYLDFVYQPVLDANGTVSGIFVEGSDVTSRVLEARRRAAITRLADSLQDLDGVEAVAQAASEIMAVALGADRAGFGIVDAPAETVDMQSNWCAPGVTPVIGRHHFRDYGSFIDESKAGHTIIIPDVAADERTADKAEALLSIGIYGLINVPIMEMGKFSLVVFVHYSQRHEWAAEDSAFVRQVGDRVQAAFSKIRSEERQRLLNHELSHRLKNTLAMVQAIAAQTLGSVTEQDAVDAFRKRLYSLAAAQDVLLGKNWASAPIRDMVTAVLSTFERPERFVVNGPDLHLASRAALSLSLVLHELATNAVKYGAISVPEGLVGVNWKIGERDGEQTLVFEWRESGGPEVQAPTRKGFGSRLIRTGLCGTGGVDVSYSPSGLEVVMTAPVSQLQT